MKEINNAPLRKISARIISVITLTLAMFVGSLNGINDEYAMALENDYVGIEYSTDEIPAIVNEDAIVSSASRELVPTEKVKVEVAVISVKEFEAIRVQNLAQRREQTKATTEVVKQQEEAVPIIQAADKKEVKKLKKKKKNEEEPKYVSDYYQVTEKELKDYFGYVPTIEELDYWEATVMAECGYNEPDEGVMAVADCIGYVRCNTDDRFPDTIMEVIGQRGQFSTWPSTIKKHLNNATDQVHICCINSIKADEHYTAAFFASNGWNSKNHAYKIGHHYFGY